VILSNALSGGPLGGRGTLRPSQKQHSRQRWLSDSFSQNAPLKERGWREMLWANHTLPLNSLLVASTAAILSCTGRLLFIPGLQLLSVPLTLVAALPIVNEAVQAVRHREYALAIPTLVGVAGALTLQQPTAAALIEVAHYTWQVWNGWREERGLSPAIEPLSAEGEVYIVRCWQEENGGGEPVLRYVLETPDSETRWGFTHLPDLMSTLRQIIPPLSQM